MQAPRATLQSARGLGRQAVVIGLETLDVARIHHRAVAAMEGSSQHDGIIKRAEIFFTEAITPIEETHHAARQTSARLAELGKTLNRHTVDLAASNRALKHGVMRRRTLEQALRKSRGHSKRLLEESRRLQKHLRRLTHQILSAQEGKRRKISRELQDEIAQILLGINVRLLTLRKEAGDNAKGFKKELAATQCLVDKSVKTIKRFAREFGKHHET